MAVSLVSTGVQFPDATIQTTAATAAPTIGAVSAGSVVMITTQSAGAIRVPSTLAFNGYNQYKTVSTGTFLPTSRSSAGDNTEMLCKPVYSAYYDMWFTAGFNRDGGSNAYGTYFVSNNGVNWNANTISGVGLASVNAYISSIAVNTSGVIQILIYTFAGNEYIVSASSDGGYTWTTAASAISPQNLNSGWFVNISIGTDFYVQGRINTADMVAYRYSSNGTTLTSTVTGPNYEQLQASDWDTTSLGYYVCLASSNRQLAYYSISGATLNSLTSLAISYYPQMVGVSSTHLFIGKQDSGTMYYTSNLDTVTVTWTAFMVSTIQAGTAVYPRWLKWTGSAWIIGLFSDNTSNTFGGSAMYYNTSSNPSTGTWTKMTLNSVGGGKQFFPRSSNVSTLYNGVGVRKV
jgi:hypothetical protein